MQALGTKPALALTAVAAVVMGATGVSAAARAADATSTTPSPVVGQPGPGGIGADATALASRLGVSVADLQAAIKAVRDSSDASTSDTDRTTEAKTIADDLDVSEATIQAVFDAEKPTARDGRGGPPPGRKPGSAPTGTTPPAATTPPVGAPPAGTTPTGTTPPPAGSPHGGPGGANPTDDSALIAAIEQATGKSSADVTAALKKADAVRDAARKERDAEFAKKLAEQLHLDQDKVLNAIEITMPTPPARAARQLSGQTG